MCRAVSPKPPALPCRETVPPPAASGGARVPWLAALPCMTAITGLPPLSSASSPTPPHSPQLRAPRPRGLCLHAHVPCTGSNLSLPPPLFSRPVCVCWAHVDGSGSCPRLKTPHHGCRMPHKVMQVAALGITMWASLRTGVSLPASRRRPHPGFTPAAAVTVSSWPLLHFSLGSLYPTPSVWSGTSLGSLTRPLCFAPTIAHTGDHNVLSPSVASLGHWCPCLGPEDPVALQVPEPGIAALSEWKDQVSGSVQELQINESCF